MVSYVFLIFSWQASPPALVTVADHLRAPTRSDLHFHWKHWDYRRGRVALPKQMNFRKKFKRPLTPPPSYLERCVANFFRKTSEKRHIWRSKICNINFWKFRKVICYGSATRPYSKASSFIMSTLPVILHPQIYIRLRKLRSERNPVLVWHCLLGNDPMWTGQNNR